MKDTQYFTSRSVRGCVARLMASYVHFRASEKELRAVEAAWNARNLKGVIQAIATIYDIPWNIIHVSFNDQKVQNKDLAKTRTRIPHGPHRIYYRFSREEVFRRGYALFVFMTAHEMAHVRMRTDRHPLAVSEVSTDILTLVMGFDTVYTDLQSSLSVTEKCGYLPKELISLVLSEVKLFLLAVDS